MTFRVRNLGYSVLLLFVACLASAFAEEAPPAPRRVLFLGNSLTYANDLPAMVTAISQRGGAKAAIEAVTVAFANAALEDHWNHGEALARIDAGGWSDVVLQQGPSSLPESRAHLVAWTKRLAARIRAVGARPALYMVWPSAGRPEDRPRVAASYAAAARAAEGRLLPVGEAWRIALGRNPKLELYSTDRFHPSPLGTYLAAVVIEAVLSERSPSAAPFEIRIGNDSLVVPEESARLLAGAAAEAISKTNEG